MEIRRKLVNHCAGSCETPSGTLRLSTRVSGHLWIWIFTPSSISVRLTVLKVALYFHREGKMSPGRESLNVA